MFCLIWVVLCIDLFYSMPFHYYSSAWNCGNVAATVDWTMNMLLRTEFNKEKQNYGHFYYFLSGTGMLLESVWLFTCLVPRLRVRGTVPPLTLDPPMARPGTTLMYLLLGRNWACIYKTCFEFWGSHSCFAEDSVLLGCDSGSLDEWCLSFWGIVVLSSVRFKLSKNNDCLSLASLV
jgi:hypothetical protein